MFSYLAYTKACPVEGQQKAPASTTNSSQSRQKVQAAPIQNSHCQKSQMPVNHNTLSEATAVVSAERPMDKRNRAQNSQDPEMMLSTVNKSDGNNPALSSSSVLESADRNMKSDGKIGEDEYRSEDQNQHEENKHECEDDTLEDDEDKEEGGEKNDERESEDEDEDEDLEKFEPTIKAINFEALRVSALMIRSRLDGAHDHNSLHLSCTIDPTPMYGGWNLAYTVQWSDNLRWVARIPGHAAEFNENDVARMDSEYHTMEYLREHTAIPIPQVFWWTTCGRVAGVPFAFMSFVEGTQLGDIWIDPDTTESTRLDLLTKVAACMAQLHQNPFPKSGTLEFDSKGRPTTIGPLTSRQLKLFEDGFGTHRHDGPYISMKTLLLKYLEEAEYPSIIAEAEDPQMRIAIETIPEDLLAPRHHFISLADLDWQNIIVNDNGEIAGFIDWDHVATKPSALGCGRYPAWITRDWDPINFDLEEYPGGPESLPPYRRHYAAALASHDMLAYDARATKVSHLLEALQTALVNELSRGYIMKKLVQHAFNGQEPWTFTEYAREYADDGPGLVLKDQQLKAAFSRMWKRESGEMKERPASMDIDDKAWTDSGRDEISRRCSWHEDIALHHTSTCTIPGVREELRTSTSTYY